MKETNPVITEHIKYQNKINLKCPVSESKYLVEIEDEIIPFNGCLKEFDLEKCKGCTFYNLVGR